MCKLSGVIDARKGSRGQRLYNTVYEFQGFVAKMSSTLPSTSTSKMFEQVALYNSQMCIIQVPTYILDREIAKNTIS